MDNKIYQAYTNILKNELIPALGCTEPIAIAFAAAKAVELLGSHPQSLVLRASGSVIKNVKSVVVPNSGGLKGIEIAAAMGSFGGDASRGLEVLEDISASDLAYAKQFAESENCQVILLEGVPGLYISISVVAGANSVTVDIADHHTSIVRIVRNDEVLLEQETAKGPGALQDKDLLNVADILKYADSILSPEVKDLIERQIELNTAIAQEGLKNNYGANIGSSLLKYCNQDDVKTRARAVAAAACDARMDGCSLPVIILSGSGNQGITVSLPVITYAQKLSVAREKLIRALIVASLITLLQKSHIGTLSAFCGVVSAAAGAAAGIAYLHGGGYKEIASTVSNTLANAGGIICDGAKASCAAKISTALEAAIMGFHLQHNDQYAFAAGDGIVKDNIEKTIACMGRVAREGMKETNVEILNIMLED